METGETVIDAMGEFWIPRWDNIEPCTGKILTPGHWR